MIDILRAVVGIALLLLLCWSLSSDRKNIKWQAVFIGLGIQFSLAFLILGNGVGRLVLQKISAAVTAVVQISSTGAEFVIWQRLSRTLCRVYHTPNDYIFYLL